MRRRADARGEDMGGLIGTVRFIHDYYAHIHLFMRATAAKFPRVSLSVLCGDSRNYKGVQRERLPLGERKDF